MLVERDGYVRVVELAAWMGEVWSGGRRFEWEEQGESWGGEETHWYREKREGK